MKFDQSKQFYFDQMVRGLAAQGWAPSMKGTLCAYRGEGGRACAVGHCIDDATAEKWDALSFDAGELANDGIDTDIGTLIEYEFAEANYETLFFLRDAQKAHDQRKDAMLSAFRELAAKHSLTWPADVPLD